MTALLVLAIAASSGLVFTSRVELLKLAVILALWAAVVAAFMSVMYRRQSDVDQARVRDLKLVYDLQLDREISARREYELTVESQLRRELAAELRTQAADEVAALRSELAALRTNLEILFDTDLGHRPALETERTTVRAYSDWDRDGRGGASDAGVPLGPVAAHPDGTTASTVENPIIDVPEVGVPFGPEPSTAPQQPVTETADGYRGSHRQAADTGVLPAANGRHRPRQQRPEPNAGPDSRQRPEPNAGPDSRQRPRPAPPRPEPAAPPTPYPGPAKPAPAPEPVPAAGWQPAAAEGAWLPPGTPGSNWVSDAPADLPDAANVDRPVDHPATVEEPAPAARHGRQDSPPEPPARRPAETAPPRPYPGGRRQAPARHSAGSPDRRTETAAAAPPEVPPPAAARHRGAEPGSHEADPQTGGQSVADLMARLQTTSTGGRRRRRDQE